VLNWRRVSKRYYNALPWTNISRLIIRDEYYLRVAFATDLKDAIMALRNTFFPHHELVPAITENFSADFQNSTEEYVRRIVSPAKYLQNANLADAYEPVNMGAYTICFHVSIGGDLTDETVTSRDFSLDGIIGALERVYCGLNLSAVFDSKSDYVSINVKCLIFDQYNPMRTLQNKDNCAIFRNCVLSTAEILKLHEFVRDVDINNDIETKAVKKIIKSYLRKNM